MKNIENIEKKVPLKNRKKNNCKGPAEKNKPVSFLCAFMMSHGCLVLWKLMRSAYLWHFAYEKRNVRDKHVFCMTITLYFIIYYFNIIFIIILYLLYFYYFIIIHILQYLLFVTYCYTYYLSHSTIPSLLLFVTFYHVLRSYNPTLLSLPQFL